jgi:hypothetical protein
MTAPEDAGTQAYRAELLAHALAYVAAGWSVAPLSAVRYVPHAKDPARLVKDFRPLIRWKTDKPLDTAAEVQTWFGGGRSAVYGLAIITGPSGLLVLDDDGYKAGRGSSLPVPAGAWVEAGGGRGGAHVYLSNAAGLRNTANAVTAVDSRGDGGLVIAAPTWAFFPDGSATQWRTARPLHELPAIAAALPGPTPELMALRGDGGQARVRAARKPGAPEIISREWAAALVAQLRGEFLETAQGTGLRHQVMRFGCSLLRWHRACGLDDEAAAEELYEELAAHDNYLTWEETELPGGSTLEWCADMARMEPWRFEGDWAASFPKAAPAETPPEPAPFAAWLSPALTADIPPELAAFDAWLRPASSALPYLTEVPR